MRGLVPITDVGDVWADINHLTVLMATPLQALVIVPTRELAVQVAQVFLSEHNIVETLLIIYFLLHFKFLGSPHIKLPRLVLNSISLS